MHVIATVCIETNVGMQLICRWDEPSRCCCVVLKIQDFAQNKKTSLLISRLRNEVTRTSYLVTEELLKSLKPKVKRSNYVCLQKKLS